MKAKMHTFAIGGMLIVLILAAAYAFLPAGQFVKSAAQPEKTTFAYTCTLDSGIAHVAEALGSYRSAGLDITHQTHPLGIFALQALLDGKVDFATAAETPIMAAIMRGEKIAIIATMHSSRNNHAIVARQDRGIQTPRDLQGKKIGVFSGSSGDYFLDAFLAVHGISRRDISTANLTPDALRNALLEGTVDAIVTLPDGKLQVQKKLAGRAIIFTDDTLHTQFFNLVTTQEFLRARPETVKKMLRALCAAEEHINKHPDDAERIIADSVRLDKTFVHEIWQDNNFSVSLEQSLLLALEDQTRWAIRSKLSNRKAPNYLEFIHTESLESVKSSAVRILK